MFENRQLTHFQGRKAVLLQKSAAHRREFKTEAQNLRRVAGWMDLGIDAARKARAGGDVMASWLCLRRARKDESAGFTRKLAAAISLARSLPALWKSWR